MLERKAKQAACLVKEDELHAELEQQVEGRGAAPAQPPAEGGPAARAAPAAVR